MLTPQQIEQYQEDGAVVVPGVLDEVMRKKMKSILAEWVEGSRAVAAHTDLYDLEPGHSVAEPRVRRIKKPHLANAVFYDSPNPKRSPIACAPCSAPAPASTAPNST